MYSLYWNGTDDPIEFHVLLTSIDSDDLTHPRIVKLVYLLHEWTYAIIDNLIVRNDCTLSAHNK